MTSRNRCSIRRGFTFIEVTVAALLLGIVGLAILAFLSAFAQGASVRTRVSDPAIEGTLAIERLHALAPQLRCVLGSHDTLAAMWLDDSVPSRTVHLSELGWVRFDRDSGEVLLERINHDAFDADRSLQCEYAHDEDFLAVRESASRAGLLTENVLAEGIDGAAFIETRGSAAVELELEAATVTARVALQPPEAQEPLR